MDGDMHDNFSFEVLVSAHATGLQKEGQFMVLLAAIH